MVARDLGTKRESLIILTHIISSSATKKGSRRITEMSNAKEQRQQTKPGLKSFPSQLWKQIMALKEFFSYSQRDRRVTPRKLNFPSWNSWFQCMCSFVSDVLQVSSHCCITGALLKNQKQKIQRLLDGIFGLEEHFRSTPPRGSRVWKRRNSLSVCVVSDVSISQQKTFRFTDFR